MDIGYGTLERLLVKLFGLSEPQRAALVGRFKYLQRLGGFGAAPAGRGRARYGLDVQADRDVPMKQLDDGVIEIGLKKGEAVTLFSRGQQPDAIVEPVAAQPDRVNTFGLP